MNVILSTCSSPLQNKNQMDSKNIINCDVNINSKSQ